MRKLLGIVSLQVVLACALFGAVAHSQPLPQDPLIIRGKLDNGMIYYIRPNHKPEKRVELRLMVRAGSLLESDNQRGIAHFIEHMGFNGTKHFESGKLVDYFESIGAEFGPDTNAYTTYDHTLYMFSLPTDPPEALDKGLTALSDYAGGDLFNPTEIDKERGVILEEHRLGRDMQTRIFDKIMEIALKGTRYPDRATIGKAEDIEKFAQSDFLDFYGKWYRPDEMAVVVVGDIDPATVEKDIKTIFSQIPKAAPQELPIYKDTPHSDIRAGIVTDRELPVSQVLVGYTRDPEHVNTEEENRTAIIENIAIGIYNDRLNELSMKENPPFKQAGGGKDWPLLGFDVVGVTALPEMKKEIVALKAVLEEIERIRRFGVLQVELDEQLKKTGEALRAAAEEKDKQESSSLASGIANDFLFSDTYTDVTTDKALFEKYKSTIKLEDVKAALERLFAPQNMTALLIMPDFMKSMYKDDDILKAVADVQKEDIKPYERKAAKKSTDYAKLVPGEIKSKETDAATGVTKVTFGNGMKVLVKPTDFQKDEIIFSGFAPGGILFETYADRGVSRLAFGAWILGGTKDLSSVEIDRLMSGKSISIASNDRENFSLNGSTVNKDFEETLQWVRDYLTIPGWRSEGVAKAKGLLEDQIKQMDADQDGVFNQALYEQLCPGKPIAYWPTAEQLDALTAQQLAALEEKSTAPGNMEFTFIGNLDVDKTIALAAKYLGSIPARPVAQIPDEMRSCNLAEGYTKRIVYKGVEARTQIAIIMPGLSMDSPDAPAVGIMSHVVETRMLKKLREELGGTYYTYLYPAYNQYLKNRNFIIAGLATDPSKVDSMIAETYNLFAGLAADGPTADEMTAAKEISLKNQRENLKKNDYWLGILNGRTASGLPLDLDLKNKDKAQEVTPEQVKAVAAKYLLQETKVEVIALPEKSDAAAPAAAPAPENK